MDALATYSKRSCNLCLRIAIFKKPSRTHSPCSHSAEVSPNPSNFPHTISIASLYRNVTILRQCQ
jgi:hypothetical protein